MWMKALQTIPRMDKQEWDGLDIVSKFLIASRSGVLIITFISAGLAGLFAGRAGMFDLGRWLLLTLGLCFAHATNNLLNDVTDFQKGVDTDNYYRAQYGPQTLVHGFLTMRQILTYAAVSGLLALAFGGYLIYLRGTTAWILLGLGVFFVLFYTWPLKYIGLGEIAVIIVWGPLMIGGGYYVITGQWDWNVVLAGLPYALGATTIIFGKHIDKFDKDKVKGIHTLPVIIGERAARYLGLSMMALQYVFVVYLVLFHGFFQPGGFFSPFVLVVFFAYKEFLQALKPYQLPKPAEAPADLPPGIWPLYFVGFAFVHNRRFGLLFLGGLILDLAWKAVMPLVIK
jgi:1,4-dihydroxy-2-naphthoate octaprenyltransferase